MMALFTMLFSFFFMLGQINSCSLKIDNLRDMVTENGVRNQLKVLDKDKTTSCYQIKQKVDEILATLSSEVKV